jgi:hypothetical protein
MGFKFKNPFKALSSVIKQRANASKHIAMNTNMSTIGSSALGVISYNPTNINYNTGSAAAGKLTEGGNFFVYPLDKQDQEHYMLFDVVQRTGSSMNPGDHAESFNVQSFANNNAGGVSNPGATVASKRLNTIIYGANRFFSEGGKGLAGIPTGKGSARRVVSSMAIYMPQNLKFNLRADYGPAEVGIGIGALAKAKDFFYGGGNWSDLGAAVSQAGKGIIGASAFLTGGLMGGVGAALQRRTGIAPSAMSEMIFNGIDYREFSFTFKFTPRSKMESDTVNKIVNEFKMAMLPERFGTASIAAYKVPFEFVIRFMKGTKINPFLEQIGLCACTAVEVDLGDKFSTHSYGDPVTTNLTITFRELELIEKQRYAELNPYGDY